MRFEPGFNEQKVFSWQRRKERASGQSSASRAQDVCSAGKGVGSELGEELGQNLKDVECRAP